MKTNKFVLITGSGRGLGKELALVFADNHYNIILHDKSKNNLAEIEKEISKKNVDHFIVTGDLKSKKTLDNLCKVSKEKRISLLINNAGVHCPNLPFEKINDKQINDLLLTNLIAPIKIICRLYPFLLKKGGGTIININSILGLENKKLRTLYCASKWGLRAFSETLKLEAKENNIRIIDVYPTRIKTRPEFKEGLETNYVARKIYETYKNTNYGKLILDHRSKKR